MIEIWGKLLFDKSMTIATTENLASTTASLYEKAVSLERKAQEFRENGAIREAFDSYDQAARYYRECGEHLTAAVCFSAAAMCWNIHTGSLPVHNAATRNELAAGEALKAKNFEYAGSLFREAALLYDKGGDWESYSSCLLKSQRADRKSLWCL